MATLSLRCQAFTLHQSDWVGELGFQNFRLLLSEEGIIDPTRFSLFFPLHSCQLGFRSFVLYLDKVDDIF